MATKIKKGDTVTKIVLKNRYDRHAVRVLPSAGYIKSKPRKKAEIQKYLVKKELPDAEAYRVLRDAQYSTTVEETLDTARDEVADLLGQLEDWYNNLPESFQDGDKGQALQEAIDSLGSVEIPEPEKEIGERSLVILPGDSGSSRSDARDDVVSSLTQVMDWADERAEDEGLTAEQLQYFIDLRGELSEAISALENVEFPGMY